MMKLKLLVLVLGMPGPHGRRRTSGRHALAARPLEVQLLVPGTCKVPSKVVLVSCWGGSEVRVEVLTFVGCSAESSGDHLVAH